VPASSVTVGLGVEVVVVSMTTAVPKPLAPAAWVVPEPPLNQVTTSAVFRRLLTSVTTARRSSCNVAVTAQNLSLFSLLFSYLFSELVN